MTDTEWIATPVNQNFALVLKTRENTENYGSRILLIKTKLRTLFKFVSEHTWWSKFIASTIALMDSGLCPNPLQGAVEKADIS